MRKEEKIEKQFIQLNIIELKKILKVGFFLGIEVGVREAAVRPLLSCLMEIALDAQLIFFTSRSKATNPIY